MIQQTHHVTVSVHECRTYQSLFSAICFGFLSLADTSICGRWMDMSEANLSVYDSGFAAVAQ